MKTVGLDKVERNLGKMEVLGKQAVVHQHKDSAVVNPDRGKFIDQTLDRLVDQDLDKLEIVGMVAVAAMGFDKTISRQDYLDQVVNRWDQQKPMTKLNQPVVVKFLIHMVVVKQPGKTGSIDLKLEGYGLKDPLEQTELHPRK